MKLLGVYRKPIFKVPAGTRFGRNWKTVLAEVPAGTGTDLVIRIKSCVTLSAARHKSSRRELANVRINYSQIKC